MARIADYVHDTFASRSLVAAVDGRAVAE